LALFILYFLTKKIIDFIFKPVEKNISEMEDFTHHAGHELKNPLASLKSSIELLKEF
jgi:signal transduction histidine kinase